MVPVLKPTSGAKVSRNIPQGYGSSPETTSSAKVSRNIPQGYGSSPETHLKC